MEKNKKTTSQSDKTKTDPGNTTPPKKRKRITNRDESKEGPGEKNKTTDHPEEHEEFINEIPDEKTEEANEVTNDNDPGRSEEVNQSGQKWHK